MSTTPAPRGRPPGPVDPLAPESEYRRYARTRPFKWWHEAIIDDMLIFPLSTNKERGARLGYSEQAIMMLTNSDMFKAAYAERRADLSSRINDSIAMKMAAVADLGLTVMKESLETKRTAIPFRDLSAANDSMLQRLGYGAPMSAPSANVQVNVNGAPQSAVTPELLAQARAKLRANESMRALEAPSPGLAELLDITPVSSVTSQPQEECAAHISNESSSD